MPIEADMTRIANSLEKIVEVLTSAPVNLAPAAPAADPAPTTSKGKDASKPKDKSTAPAAPPPPPPPPPEPEVDPLDDPATPPAKQPTADDVRAALKAYRDIEGAGAMMDVLKRHGAESLAALKPEKFAEVIAEVSKVAT